MGLPSIVADAASIRADASSVGQAQQIRSQSWIVNETRNLLSTGLRHWRELHA